MVRVLVATAVREAVPLGAWFGPTCTPRAAACGAAAAACTVAAAAAAEVGMQQLRLNSCCTAAAPAAVQRQQEASWDDRALLRAIAAGDRSLTAPAAPAEGLCFLEAGYAPLPA